MQNNTENQDEQQFPQKGESLTENNLEGLNDKDEQTEAVPDEDLSGSDKPSLLNRVEEILKNEDLEPYKNIVNKIRDQYRDLTKQEVEQKKAEFETSKEDDDEFEYSNPLDEQFEEKIKLYFENRAQQKKKKEKQLNDNLKQKKEVLDALKALPESSSNISLGFEKLQSLQTLWHSIGPVPSGQADSLWKNYKFYVSKFYEGVKLSNELKDLDHKKNLQLKTELCEKAEQLVNEPSLRRALEELSILQESWRNVGFAMKDENDKIWQRFRAAATSIYERKKKFIEGQNEKLNNNLETKKQLVAELEALLPETVDSQKQLQQLEKQVEDIWERWKKIGPVPKSDNDNTWNKFRKLRQRFQQLKDEHYSQLNEGLKKNLDLKTALCEKAEALKESSDWDKAANDLKRLQREWKEIGPVPRKVSDKIWKRFRAACDHFFNRKQENVKEQEKEFVENLEKKKQIIERINSFEHSGDIKADIENLNQLKNEFNEAGHVPFSDKNQVQKDFSAAVNKVLNKIKETAGESKVVEKMKYEELVKTNEGKEQIRKERSFLQDKIKRLQHDVNLWENNISFFAKSKNAQSMIEEFNQKIEQGKVELKKLQDRLKLILVVERQPFQR